MLRVSPGRSSRAAGPQTSPLCPLPALHPRINGPIHDHSGKDLVLEPATLWVLLCPTRRRGYLGPSPSLPQLQAGTLHPGVLLCGEHMEWMGRAQRPQRQCPTYGPSPCAMHPVCTGCDLCAVYKVVYYVLSDLCVLCMICV